MTNMMATQTTQAARRTKSAKWSKKKNKKKVRGGSDASDEDETGDVMKDIVYDTSAQEEWAHFCQEYDVVITTYPVMTHELSVAKGAVSRPRRDNVEYGERSLPKSPLIMVEFWRVIMDEVQLSGGTNTEEMVSRIPRCVLNVEPQLQAHFTLESTHSRSPVLQRVRL
jgi:E3 ubiquitin-protein ligase SHPRH